jgi:oxygen-independent coproporphyrinogen-3 oxidase
MAGTGVGDTGSAEAASRSSARQAQLRALIARHDRPGPRYTSYPTAPVWTPEFGAAELRDALGRVRGPDLALYVHVPFCERLCSFCACNRVITRDHSVAGPYLDGLRREADLLAGSITASTGTVQLALGGGSPNFLSPEELAELCRVVDSRFPPAPDAERSIELDPRSTRREQLEALVEHGFNRASLGVQDTSPRVQRAINRIQPTESVERLTSLTRELGIESVSFDLIYGRSSDSSCARSSGWATPAT